MVQSPQTCEPDHMQKPLTKYPTLALVAGHAVIGTGIAALMGADAGSRCGGQWLCSPELLATVYAAIYGLAVAFTAAAVGVLWLGVRHALCARLWVAGLGPPIVALVTAGLLSS